MLIKGSTRIVWPLPSLGLAVKFSRISILGLFEVFRFLIRETLIPGRTWAGVKYFAWWLWRMPHQINTPLHLLFWGILTNWREFVFYLTTRHPFLQPTYFSLLGLINVQKYGQAAQGHLKLGLSLSITGALSHDGHHFFCAENFVISKTGAARLLDYGDPKTQHLIRTYGQELLAMMPKIMP